MDSHGFDETWANAPETDARIGASEFLRAVEERATEEAFGLGEPRPSDDQG